MKLNHVLSVNERLLMSEFVLVVIQRDEVCPQCPVLRPVLSCLSMSSYRQLDSFCLNQKAGDDLMCPFLCQTVYFC